MNKIRLAIGFGLKAENPEKLEWLSFQVVPRIGDTVLTARAEYRVVAVIHDTAEELRAEPGLIVHLEFVRFPSRS